MKERVIKADWSAWARSYARLQRAKELQASSGAPIVDMPRPADPFEAAARRRTPARKPEEPPAAPDPRLPGMTAWLETRRHG
jgi:hypothetical protein